MERQREMRKGESERHRVRLKKSDSKRWRDIER
jgi:hypothetical protein